MKKEFFVMNLLLLILSAEMIMYRGGFAVLGIILCVVTMAQVPTLDEKKKESMLILRPLIVSVVGLTLGIIINFFCDNYFMDNYCYCFLTAILSYLTGIGGLVFYRTYIVRPKGTVAENYKAAV